jgi:hypothetical protein
MYDAEGDDAGHGLTVATVQRGERRWGGGQAGEKSSSMFVHQHGDDEIANIDNAIKDPAWPPAYSAGSGRLSVSFANGPLAVSSAHCCMNGRCPPVPCALAASAEDGGNRYS